MDIKFDSYASFNRFLRDDYRPLPEELNFDHAGFVPGTHWAQRGAPRFYRALRAIAPYLRPGATLLDIGAYPGSFPRLARAAFGEGLRVVACGMPCSGRLVEGLGRDGIEFRACNLDPDVRSPVQVPEGLPFDDGAVDVVTCTEVVEHLYSLRTTFLESARVLAPGGVLYVTTDNVANLEGALRLVRSGGTNLDDGMDQTSIWSDATDQWRGHVRFYSIAQLVEAGARAGLSPASTACFEHFEDPDVFARDDRGPLAPVRRLLRGRGDAPPVQLRRALLGLIHLGPRSLSARFANKIEVVLRK